MTMMLPERFRRTMAGVPTPVAVVTTMSADRPHGTTVSAWTSLSMEPPMALVSLDRASRLLAHLRESRRFGLNILAANQAAVATSFASKGDDKFGGLRWEPAEGLPRLAGVAGWLACVVTEFVPGGDHVIVLGEVVAAEPVGSLPLTYHDRRFGTHVPLPQRESADPFPSTAPDRSLP